MLPPRCHWIWAKLEVTIRLDRRFRRLAGDAGHAVSEDVQREVEGILHCVPPTRAQHRYGHGASW